MKIDIIAEDANGKEVLIAEVRGRALDEPSALAALESLRESKLPARFGMVADPVTIRIADFEDNGDQPFICVFKSTEIFRHYSPEYGRRRVFQFYVRALTEAWLRDVAYHWNSETPPKLDDLTRIGLAQRLQDGATRSEVIIETDSVY